jgi:ribose-phosphate pyrophosphokinase
MLLMSGSANRPLAEEVANHLGQPLCQLTLRRFADGEIFPPAENMLELLLLIDAARRASAARVTAVIPYFGYARQDRKDQPRVAISAKLMANMITRAGADRVLAMDFHQHQLQGFFDLPVDHLYAAPVFTGSPTGWTRRSPSSTSVGRRPTSPRSSMWWATSRVGIASSLTT